MSKLVLFLFLGVCVMAVHMAPVEDDSEDDAALEEFVNSLEPQLEAELSEIDPRIRVNWKKVWQKTKQVLKEVGSIAKPILVEAGRGAAAAKAAGAIGKKP